MMTDCGFSRRLLWLFLAFLVALFPTQTMAQYQVFSWENFESGAFPTSLGMKHQATPSNVTIFDYNSPGAPPGILSGAARTECGRFGLKLQTDESSRFLSIVSGLTLDRKRLGAKGKALYQADFYLPADNTNITNMAVLAVVPTAAEQKEIWQLYRLGILGGTRIYFSYANNTPQPIIYEQENIESLNVQRPSWHRFQIIFEGQDKIFCAVDGKTTQFSPITEPSLVQLQAGIMVTSPEGKPGVCYADNLSIQWTPEDAPLPDSPWFTPIESTPAAPGSATRTAPEVVAGSPSPSQPAHLPAQAGQQWLTSTDEAWDKARAEKRPILVLFYIPRIEVYENLQQVFQTDRAAQDLLVRFIPLRIDANQLSGGMLAQKFNVFKVPYFIVIGPDSKEWARAVVGKSPDWSAIVQTLQNARPPK
jgi:hypothetical protein